MPDTDLFLQLAKKRSDSPLHKESIKPTKKQAPQAPETALEWVEPLQPISQVLQVEKRDLDSKKANSEANRGISVSTKYKSLKTQTPDRVQKDVKTEVKTEVMTSILHGVDKKKWREVIEDTETHNSSLRMSAKEKEQIEDAVRELKREYKIKTSINEIARLGLLLLEHDFKQRGGKSIIAHVKKS